MSKMLTIKPDGRAVMQVEETGKRYVLSLESKSGLYCQLRNANHCQDDKAILEVAKSLAKAGFGVKLDYFVEFSQPTLYGTLFESKS